MTAPAFSRLEHLRLRDFLILERLDELGSLRQVAESMHLTQPAVTQALQSIEDAFGVQLVLRGSSGATLSPSGKAALGRLKALKWEATCAREVAMRPEEPIISLGCNQSAAVELIPASISHFQAQGQKGRIALRELASPVLWQMLANGKIDAIVCRMLDADAFYRLESDIRIDVLSNESMVLACAADHPLTQRPLVKADLATERWVLPPQDSYTLLALNDWFLCTGIAHPTPSVISESFQTSMRLAAQSRLLTVVPEWALKSYSGPRALKEIPVPTDWRGFASVFACRASALENSAVAALRASILAEAEIRLSRHKFS